MAGPLAVIFGSKNDQSHRQQLQVFDRSQARDQWPIEFARFFNYPSSSSSSSHCTQLVPLCFRKYRPRGVWLSTSSQVSLHLTRICSGSDAILTVRSGDTVFEEHFASKLRYSWPQLSCIPDFPARGSRSVFMCYRDHAGKIQKFAVRLLTLNEAERFISALEGILEHAKGDHELPQEISLPSDFMSSNKPLNRQEEDLTVIPPPLYSPEKLPSLIKVEQPSVTQETISNCSLEDVLAALPPSFTSLLTNCGSLAEQASAEGAVAGEVDLKSLIAKYLEDSSFHDMLFKVEKIIGDNGYM